jgi:hypothetical protein
MTKVVEIRRTSQTREFKQRICVHGRAIGLTTYTELIKQAGHAHQQLHILFLVFGRA